jgi:CBS domain-containing membrane protein
VVGEEPPVTVEGEQHNGLQGRLVGRFGPGGGAAYGFAGCAIGIAVCGLAAHLAKQPLLFPSLGPSAPLFFEKPTAPESSPDSAVVGHLVGILAGLAAIAVFGLLDAPSVLEAGVSLARVGAAALSVALVALALPPLRASHPSRATTLLVSLGLLVGLALQRHGRRPPAPERRGSGPGPGAEEGRQLRAEQVPSGQRQYRRQERDGRQHGGEHGDRAGVAEARPPAGALLLVGDLDRTLPRLPPALTPTPAFRAGAVVSRMRSRSPR